MCRNYISLTTIVMDKFFWNLENSVRRVELKVGTKNEVEFHATEFLNDISSTSKEERIEHLSIHKHDMLIRVKKFMSNEPAFRSLHDKIFSKTLNVNNRTPITVTRIFAEVIKGVTYFQNENNKIFQDPIYHRLTSCGPYHDKTFKDVFQQCKPSMTKKKRSRVKKLIQRCYTERLIYNEIFIHETLHESQDSGHKKRLEETKKDFLSCFPAMDIKVTLSSYIGILPRVINVQMFKNGKCISTETYTKDVISGMTLYEEQINCELYINNVKKAKVQSFEKEKRWNVVKQLILDCK